MKQRTYKTYAELKQVAEIKQQEILETRVSFYFRIFENKQCKELHIFYK